MSARSIFARALVPAVIAALAAGNAAAADLTEGFDTVLPAGWTQKLSLIHI